MARHPLARGPRHVPNVPTGLAGLDPWPKPSDLGPLAQPLWPRPSGRDGRTDGSTDELNTTSSLWGHNPAHSL